MKQGVAPKYFLNNEHIHKKITSEREYKRISKFFFIRKWYDLKKRANKAEPFQNSDEYKTYFFHRLI